MSEGEGAPSVILSADNGEEATKCTVKFQCGLFREEETFVGEDVDILCAESLLEYVSDLLASRVSTGSTKCMYI